MRDAWLTNGEYTQTVPNCGRTIPHAAPSDFPQGAACLNFLATQRAWRLANRQRKCSMLRLKNIPWLIGGSADLAPSTKTRLTFEGAGDFSAENYAGRNFHFGVREHAMGAILNGMSLVKVRPFGFRFFIFVDYMRGSLRLSALMELPVIYVFTHDSIGVGEDGPTHQPIEQLAHMRATPGLIVIRPADANEVGRPGEVILQLHHEPAVLVLTRQAVPTIDRTKYAAASAWPVEHISWQTHRGEILK